MPSIDTLKFGLTEWKIDSKAPILIQPSIYNASTGENNDPCLYVNSEGKHIKGDRGFLNTANFNFDIKKGFDGSTYCTIKTSIPKLADGKLNYNPVSIEDTISIIGKLNKELNEIGIETNLFNAKPTEIHLFKNIELEEEFNSYVPVLQNLRLRHKEPKDFYRTTFNYGGITPSGAKSGYQFSIYSKKDDIFNNPSNQNMNLNAFGLPRALFDNQIARFEYRSYKTAQIRTLFNSHTVGNFFNNCKDLSEIFNNLWLEKLFNIDGIDGELQTSSETFNIWALFHDNDIKQWKKQADDFLINCHYYDKGITRLDIQEWLILKGHSKQNAVVDSGRIFNKIEKARFQREMLQVDKHSKKRLITLYDELKSKLVA
jgi:hypothetical protein